MKATIEQEKTGWQTILILGTLPSNGVRNKAAKLLVRLGIPHQLFSPTLQFVVRR